MSDEGYLQLKLKEQNEKVLNLENELKKIKIEVSISKQQFQEATKLMQDATDINKFKIDMILAMRKEAQDAVQRQQLSLYDANKKNLLLLTEEALKHISKEMNKEKEATLVLNGALIRVLGEKRIISLEDILKMEKYAKELMNDGFAKNNLLLFQKIKELRGLK